MPNSKNIPFTPVGHWRIRNGCAYFKGKDSQKMKQILKESALGAFCVAYGVALYWLLAWIDGCVCL